MLSGGNGDDDINGDDGNDVLNDDDGEDYLDGVGSGSGDLTLYGVGSEDKIIGFTSGGTELDLGAMVQAAGGQLTLGTDNLEFLFT